MSRDESFGRPFRLGRETGQVVRKGRKVSLEPVNLYYKERERPGFAAVTGKKVGKSHERYRLKRLSREIFRKHRQELKNYGIVVIFKPGSKFINHGELEELLYNVWKKEELIKENI